MNTVFTVTLTEVQDFKKVWSQSCYEKLEKKTYNKGKKTAAGQRNM